MNKYVDYVIKIETIIFYIFIYKNRIMSRAHALPSHALPSHAVALIREYSKPLTRSNWRKSKPIITTHMLYQELIRMYKVWAYVKKATVIKKLLTMILINIENTEWFWMYDTIRNNGLHGYYAIYFDKYGVNHDYNICDIDGIQFAIQYHINKFKPIQSY